MGMNPSHPLIEIQCEDELKLNMVEQLMIMNLCSLAADTAPGSEVQKFKISVQRSDVRGDDGFVLCIEKTDNTAESEDGVQLSVSSSSAEASDSGIQISFAKEKECPDKMEAASTKSNLIYRDLVEENYETVLCVPDSNTKRYRVVGGTMIDTVSNEPVVARVMEYAVVLDRPCLFRLSDLIKQYRTWKNKYPEYLAFKSCAHGTYVDPPHPFSRAGTFSHTDAPTCTCRLCGANRKVVDYLESEGITLDHILDAAIDCVSNRLASIVMAQMRMRFLDKNYVYLDLKDGFEAIVPPLTVLRFEAFFKQLYEAGIMISWEILRKLSHIVSYDVTYDTAIHFITYLFESADKFVEVAERLEPMFICFDWQLIHYGLYFKVFLLHFFQEFVFQKRAIIGMWTLCYDIVRNSRIIQPNRPGEMCTRDIMEKYDALVLQMNVVRDLWDAKLLPFKFEEKQLSIQQLKLNSLFPPYRALEENILMIHTAIWNPEKHRYDLGLHLDSEDEEEVINSEPILEVSLTNPTNRDEKACIQVFCKDKAIMESPISIREQHTPWNVGKTTMEAVRKVFKLKPSVSKSSESLNNQSDAKLMDSQRPFMRGDSKRPLFKKAIGKGHHAPRCIVLPVRYSKGRSFTKGIIAHKMLTLKRKRFSIKLAKLQKYKKQKSVHKSSAAKYHATLEEMLGFAIYIGSKAVKFVESDGKKSPDDEKFFVAFRYSKCKVSEKSPPRSLVPLDQVMSLLYGTLYKHSLLTEKERKSASFRLFQGNEANRSRDPKSQFIEWSVCSVCVTLFVHALTPVKIVEDHLKNMFCGGPLTKKVHEADPEVMELIHNALARAVDEEDRERIKKRLLEALKPLLKYMEPNLTDFSEASKKTFDKLRPGRVLNKHNGSATGEAPPKSAAAAASKPTTSSDTPQDPKERVPSNMYSLLLKSGNQTTKSKLLYKKSTRHSMPEEEDDDTYMGISRADPLWNRPPATGVSVTVSAEKTTKSESRRSSVNQSVEDEDEHGSCGIAGCIHDHRDAQIHAHIQGCMGGTHADPNCECCSNGHGIAAMMSPEDCKRCTSQMGGLPVNPKYPQMRQRMLKTLNQRVLVKQTAVCKFNTFLQVQKTNEIAKKPTSKKEKVAATPFPQTDNVDELVSMIEGTKISTDPKKLAKRARQKERKVQLQREEDERRLKLEEEQKRIEEQRRKEEEERLRLEELERLEKERLEAAATKKPKKKKKKNKNTAKAEDTSVNAVMKEVPSVSVNGSGSSVQANKTEKRKPVEINPIEYPAQSSITVKSTQEKSDANCKPTEMVTIRRHPTVPDTTVTISMKSNSGQEDLLYTLVNGQRCEDNVGRSDLVKAANVEAEKQKSNKKKKKKKGKGKDTSENTLSAVVSEIPVTTSLTNGSKPQSAVYGGKQTLETGKSCSYMSTLPPEKEIDLSKLKLPPGITITKVNQHVTTNRGYIGGLTESTNEVIVQNASEGHYNMNGSSPNYYNEVFKKPSVIVVDSHTSKPNDFASNDDFLCRQDIEKFKEVVSAKTKRMRNRAQRRDGDDYEDPDYCDGEQSETVETAGICDFGTKFRQRPITNYPKKVSCRQKLSHVGINSVNAETKTKGYGQTNTGNFQGRNYTNTARPFRNQQMEVMDTCGDEEPNHYNVRGRNPGGVFNNPNVIPRYAKAREQMNGGHEVTNESFHGHHNVMRNSVNQNPVSIHPSYTHVPFEPTTINSSSCSVEYRANQPLDTRRCQANVVKQSNDGDCAEDASSVDDRWKSAKGKVPNASISDVPNVTNRWDALLKESYGSTFGPFTVQAGDRQTWSPWGELSGTEASSPDQSSRPQSCDMLITEMKVDYNGSAYGYNGYNQKPSCPSPVERPTPIPIGVAPPREGVHQNGFPQAIKKQCLVNPIARPSSRNSRPDSMLSNRSSAEDLSVNRISLPTSSPAITSTLQPPSSTAFGVRDVFTNTNRQEVFGESSFAPGYPPSDHSYVQNESQASVSIKPILPIGSRPTNSVYINGSESNAMFPTSNPGSGNYKTGFTPMPTYQWGGNSNDNRMDCSRISLGGLGSGSSFFGHNNSYEGSNIPQENGNHSLFKTFQSRVPQCHEPMTIDPVRQNQFKVNNMSDFYRDRRPEYPTAFTINKPRTAIGAERSLNLISGGQPQYPIHFDQS